MNIKTLEYIHQLLIDNAKEAKFVYENARKLQHEYEESESENAEELAKSQESWADDCMKAHSEALKALNDFESQDWR